VGGFSQCTPVCDGRNVFVGFGNGLVACYDLAGKREWLRLVEHSTASYGHGSSPVLVGDKLIVHYADLVALNIADGSEAWRTRLPPNHGTSIAVKIAGEDAIFHPNGVLIRVADGKVFADNLGSSGPNSPIVHDGIAYFFRGEGRAARLPQDLLASTKADDVWKARLKGGGYWFSSPILHEGLLYGLSAQGILNVIEATTGKPIYEERLDLGQGEVYSSVSLAGELLFISSDSGTTLVLKPGREYQVVARNTLEPFRSTPVFEGRHMYVRTLKNLWCIGE
jgi:outer membrane protein assembly factor BamB